MNANEILHSDCWLNRSGAEQHIVISSRARYARNLPGRPFPMRARPDELRSVVESAALAISKSGSFSGGTTFNLAELPSAQRHYLRENHLISGEMEKSGAHRLIFLNQAVNLALMINEEDHFRMYALEPGFQLSQVLNNVIDLDVQLSRELDFAFSPKYGFLTACPTNTGTGLRVSVLLHLPALSSTRQLADYVKGLRKPGLTIRGPYGENSENLGDLFQISNEITLGKTEHDIVAILTAKVEEIIAAEEQARRMIMDNQRNEMEDHIWRAWGLLTHARLISSQEAVQNLSRLRLGVDRNWFPHLGHAQLNRLLIQVQPGHLQLSYPDANADNRDAIRATFLRTTLQPPRH